MNTLPLIGADPEMFVACNGVISSAIGFVGGTKEEPRPVQFGALQEDNVLLEFNITPASDLSQFRNNIHQVMAQANDSIRQYQLQIARELSSHSFTEGELRNFGEKAFVFGCDPDFNAWNSMANPKPNAKDVGLRTAGGHIHIGYSHIEEVNGIKNEDLIRMCDYYLGLPSVLLDKDDRRRELYGKGGAFRHKSYGAEYRTLSNFWIFSDNLIAWAYENSVKAYLDLEKLAGYESIISGDEVQRIINSNDKSGAKAALEALEIKYA